MYLAITCEEPSCHLHLLAFQTSIQQKLERGVSAALLSRVTAKYWEHLPLHPENPGDGQTRIYLRTAGDITTRAADAPHRIAVPPRHATPADPVITLFITGARHREWGFWCPKGWRHWRQFTDPTDSGQIGRGCGD